jgi:hypothetical protein
MASTEDARAAIERHLYECEPAAGMKYQSSLIAILGDARGAANRDGEGRVKPNKRSQSWLGATAYLIMLDQVGKVFKVNGAPDTFDHPIGLAISHFTPIQDEAIIEALYALRCALAHDYSLFNRDKHGTRPMRPCVQLHCRHRIAAGRVSLQQVEPDLQGPAAGADDGRKPAEGRRSR